MKKLLFIFYVSATSFVFAERVTFPEPQKSARSQHVSPLQGQSSPLFFSNVISEMDLEKITIQGQDFTALQMEGYVFHGAIGHPKLPAKTQLLEVPLDAKIEINILSIEYLDIELSRKGFTNQLFPVQPPMRKSAIHEPALTKNRSAYRQKSFNSRALVDVEHLGIMKDRRFVQLNVLPVQYLPSKNIIRVYYAIDFEIHFTESTETQHSSAKSKSLVPNAKIYQIVSDRKFSNALEPFMDWKIQKGFEVQVAYTDDIGGSGATLRDNIKNYLQAVYDNPATRADYLLLVGDTDEIPAFPTALSTNNYVIQQAGGTHITDFYYAEYTSDPLPDVLYGRLSANTLSDLDNQIEKILTMEQMTVSTDFLKNSLLIAGRESGRNGRILDATINYAEDYYFNSSHNIISTVISSSEDISTARPRTIAALNSGVGFANYTGHGLFNQWQYDGSRALMNVSDVNGLNNMDKYPFVITNACLTNQFNNSSVCLGETLLRGEKRGAVGHIGSTNSTFFGEDFQWSVGTVSTSTWSQSPDYDPNFPNNITPQNSGPGVYDRLFRAAGMPVGEWVMSAGEIMRQGNMSVQLGNATLNDDMKRYYWEVYHLLGDPSYMPYLFEPQQIDCEHLSEIFYLTDTLIIENAPPYAYAGFSQNGQLLAAGQADGSGQIILEIAKELSFGFAQLVVTAQNHSPYRASVLVSSLGVPILVVNDHKLSIGSNAVAQPIFGETVNISMELKNIRNIAANNISVNLQTDNPFVEIVPNAEVISVLENFDSVWTSHHQLIISPQIPNRHNIRILATVSYSDSLETTHNFDLIAASPEFVISAYSVVDDQGYLTLTNSGLAELSNAQIQLVSQTPELSVSGFNPSIATFTPNSSVPFTFNLTKTQSAPAFLPYTLDLSVEKDEFSFQTQIQGGLGNLVEDFERGYFHELIWYPFGQDFEWEMDTTTEVYEGNFSVRSKQGLDDPTIVTQDFDLIGEDSIVFYYKVSSAEDDDFLEFWIWHYLADEEDYDYEEIAIFSGEIPWTRFAYKVESGVQFFEWTYVKYGNTPAGQDRAWVDYITFPSMKNTPNVPDPPPASIAVRSIPDHIAFDVVVNQGQLHARINAETPMRVTISLVNTVGQPVATIASNNAVNVGQNDFYFDLTHLPQGVYICTFYDGNRILSRKIVW
ncbi:MAG: C25 family cysteine peptidase [Bacteroidales bacterium]|nr:C25 family cysteine peptidase [Bacteroidales bacterium]